uniref:probable N-acetylglucosaminyl-phosphatidylinositol de-N-acetylase n=1 Tax=Erigeron canadensis TaxID=72917 RepID=UPI001CB89F6B
DSFGKIWNNSTLSKIVEKKILDHAIEIIITFDDYGVSGHCNHRDVHHGVRKFMLDTSLRELEAWELVSTNIIRKYCRPIDIWLSLWSAQNSYNERMHCLLNEHPLRSYAAMSEHLSQWVWFQKLFVSFSSYTYVNTLRKIMV